MSVTFCFWALLSLDNFEFVYLPSFIKDTEIATGITVGNVLLSHSLLEFIHPDELSLATTDLLNFVRIKTLAGAITRCRLRRIKSLVASDSLKNEDWKVTDVVMYTAANKTILTFFHTHQVEQENTNTYTSTPYRSSCYYNAPLHENEAAIISETLQKYSLPLTIEDPFRLFQIYNTEDKKLLFQWPTYTTFNEHLDSFSSADSNKDREKCFESIIQYATNLSVEEIDRQTQNTQFRSGTDCTHHSHSNSVAFLEPCGVCQIEKIVITYGSLTFSSFQFTPIDNHFYHQHLNRIPSSTSSTDKQMTNQSTTNNNYEKFMKSFMGDNTSPVHVSLPPIATSPVKESKSSPRSTTSSQETVPKKTESEEKKPPSKSSSSNKLTLPKAWKSRFGITEKKCENCSTNKSPEWRRGPTGHKTLCNACGLRYARLVAKQEKKKSKSDDDEKYKP